MTLNEKVEQELAEQPERELEAASVNMLEKLSATLNADFYLYSGVIDRDGANKFIDLVEQSKSHRDNVALILTTNGGTADAAYRVTRYLKRSYKKFALYVLGPCKSAGTLLALGADEIVMSCWGEFGPLDVQLIKRDDLAFRNSGLDIAEALKEIKNHAFDTFEKQFIEMISRSGGTISTKMAADIGKALAVGLLSPITQQIDPLQIGEVQRALRVASDYAERLKADPRTITRLIRGYASHSFVIDYDEAKDLFPSVRLTTPLESQLERSLLIFSEEATGHDCIREQYPHAGPIIAFLNPEAEDTDDDESEQQGEERDDHADVDKSAEERQVTVDHD